MLKVLIKNIFKLKKRKMLGKSSIKIKRRTKKLNHGFRKMWIVTVLAFAMILFPNTYGKAEEANEVTFGYGENNVRLTDTLSIQVTNDKEASSITITENGQELYRKDVSLTQVTDFNLVESGEEVYGIITYRHDGSANALYFEVVKFNESSVDEVFTSYAYGRATMEVTENEIILEYPEYAEEDVMTDPSAIATQKFSISGAAVETGQATVTELQDEKSAKLQSNKYTNPSYAEINQLLTEKAIDAGIAPEILKAIAYQESGWQQFWETVPDRVKDGCKVNDGRKLKWDGTNAKLGYDCIGIGIMQISNHMYMSEGKQKDDYIKRLKEDIEFNIDEGIKILLDKWNYGKTGRIPTINDGESMVIENWYFAILAYNGLLERNNPLTNPYTAYQESVINRMRSFSQVDITPFPTQILEPYTLSNGTLGFRSSNYKTTGPEHYSSQSMENGQVAYTTADSLNLRESASTNAKVVAALPKGTKVTVTGKYKGNNSRTNQFVWLPVKTSAGKTGWVASSYLTSKEYIDVYRLEGSNRFETGVAVSNHGWHWEQPEYVVIGRGDLPIDSLTGSVLASGLDAPLLLTRNDRLTPAVEQELKRLAPKFVYILGSKNAISSNVEDQLKKIVGTKRVERLEGSTRYGTAKSVAEIVASRHTVKQVFVTTGDETSSDPLAIAPYAGEKDIPILLTNKKKLSEEVTEYIHAQGINKVTIIGGKNAVSASVESELKKLVGTGNVERVSGDARFDTSIAIINTYYNKNSISDLFIAQGMDIADSLSAAPFAAKKGSPLVLTLPDKVPAAVNTWLKSQTRKPDLYFLGGDGAISNSVRNSIKNLVK